MPTVTAHRLEQRQSAQVRDATWQTARWAMRTRIVQNRLFGRLNITEAVGLAAVLAIGVRLALTGEATPGEVTAASLLFLRAVAPVAAMLFVMGVRESAGDPGSPGGAPAPRGRRSARPVGPCAHRSTTAAGRSG
ncbi:hypothetical protein GT204_12300 [Streptomyces sp. SID4919]|uniref:ABC transporter ATP-binding protein n=1 Tax=unclassified Streptomyces TaxID=2593676 RepID=UPI000823C577|nr:MULTISPECIES: ABC transporter ATP-binding protein [unclassified Streptomyces]MYY09670.1 hypothetical protein [Streptomyces sp. SID4919]SCK35413.1 hypothetical protein YW7DRAFT_02925 [Streptomyces sp. AmelKG-E11A]